MAPDSAPGGRPTTADRPATSSAEPAGGTTTPFVRWTSGSFCFGATRWPTRRPNRTEDATSRRPTSRAQFEQAIYQRWLDADVFAPDGAGSTADPALPPFVIIQPPPNVTGSLHLGHAQRSSVEDLMIRHARMLGRPTLWLPGLDHASIAAQVVLDRIIAAEGETRAVAGPRAVPRADVAVRRDDAPRDARAAAAGGRVASTGAGSGSRWTRCRHGPSASRFTRLYREGLAYRAEALINWCPGCRTSVSDLEVIPTPEIGSLWTIRYHLVGADGRPIARRDDRHRHDPARDAARRHRGRRQPGDPRYAALVGPPGRSSRSSIGSCRSSPTSTSSGRSERAR